MLGGRPGKWRISSSTQEDKEGKVGEEEAENREEGVSKGSRDNGNLFGSSQWPP